MIGIYKITSPTKRVYIGQSTNIEKRFLAYKKINCKKQTMLYNSLKKHGVDKHKFEVLCECEVNELNEKERYYQDLYCVLGKGGLNCRLTASSDRSGFFSEEVKLKMSLSQTGKKNNIGWFVKMKGRKLSEDHKKKIIRTGYKHKEETKAKISKAHKGKKLTDDHKLKLTGKKHSEETKLKMSISKRQISDKTREKMSLSRIGNKNRTTKKVLNKQNNKIYDSIKCASIELNIKYWTLYQYLNGIRYNKTKCVLIN
jgi:group I intron endonuclease